MNLLIQERNNHNENCLTVKVSRRTQKIELTLISDDSSQVIFSTDLGNIFGSEIVRILSLMIYTDIVEYNIVGDTKAPLLRCFPFTSKLKSGDLITTGQYMNYQTFSNLQFRRHLKNSFHSIHIDLSDTSGEKISFVSVGITRLVLMFRKVSDIHY